MNKREGKIFVIDGKDGSGKATQTQLLAEHLRSLGHEVETMDFPRYTQNFTGGIIRECLDGKHGDFISLDPILASMPYAIDRFESKPTIVEWLAAGKIVILDRYVSANQIHQGGKFRDEAARKAFLDRLDRLEYGLFGLPRPDRIIFLDVPVEVSMKLAADRAAQRGVKADVAESDAKHQLESQESALSIIKASNDWVRIDCGDGQGSLRPREAILQDIFNAVKELIA
jgi:dTMP kinase